MVAGFGLRISAGAADLTWEVVNPFRLYKDSKSFSNSRECFKAVRGEPNVADAQPTSSSRVERCLNDPDPASPWAAACRSAAAIMWSTPRLRLGGSRRSRHLLQPGSRSTALQFVMLARRTVRAPENYVLPRSTSSASACRPSSCADAGNGDCSWSWKPRAGGAASQPLIRPVRAEGADSGVCPIPRTAASIRATWSR